MGVKNRMENKFRKFWDEWRGFFVFVIVMLMFRSTIADWNQVPSGSMKPGILEGDRIVVDKLAYDLRVPWTFFRILSWSDPARGDVVTFENPKDQRLFVKRVVGVPGDTLEVRGNALYVNGKRAGYMPLSNVELADLDLPEKGFFNLFRESLLDSERLIMMRKDGRGPRGFCRPSVGCGCLVEDWHNFGPIKVPEDRYWVMGDNRDNSNDSRDPELCFLERRLILGRAYAIAFSIDFESTIWRPRTERFFSDL